MHRLTTLHRSWAGIRRLAAACAVVAAAACSDSSKPPPTQPPPTPTPAKVEVVSGNDQRGGPGEQLPVQLVVRVTDNTGKAYPGATVAWAVTAGGGSVSPATSTTDAQGQASATLTLGPVAGSGTVTATVGVLAPATFNALTRAVTVQTVNGTVTLPAGAAVAPQDLQVVTLVGKAAVGADGKFVAQTPAADKYQLVLVNSAASGATVMMGVRQPGSATVSVSDSSTARALLLLNPYLVYADQAQRAAYLHAAEGRPEFATLLSLLRTAYAQDPANALNYGKNTRIYQTVAELMRATLQAMGAAALRGAAAAAPSAPYVEDIASDPRIRFVNPRHVYYGAAIVSPQGQNVIAVKRTETLVSFHLGWPPVMQTQPAVTEYSLGDGSYELRLRRGLDFGKFLQLQDPAGMATVLNTATGLQYLLELLVGHLPETNVLSLPQYLHISERDAAALALAVSKGDAQDFLLAFGDLLVNNSEEIAYWVWQENQNAAATAFIRNAATMLSGLSLAMELLGMVNEQGPFFWDLITAPKELTYYVTQSGGTITSTQKNGPPTASFTLAPPSGVVGTTFTADASASGDDHDARSQLTFRWDWESDGKWDTPAQPSLVASHSYATAGAYTITLQVADASGLTSEATRKVNVGGGGGTATHIKLFRDVLPWSSNSMEHVFEAMGFRPGTGPGTYEIIGSGGLGTTPLVPGQDLVIIANDQTQAFYDAYARQQIRFTSFVYAGGSMLWGACDVGWANGSMQLAGVILPGNLGATFELDNWNFVVDQALPLVKGLPNSMDHNYASHESFSGLPDGTTVYTVNSAHHATLVEFNLGKGWLMVTGQPLEHQYDRVYGSPDMELLLPRIVGYFTGRPLGAQLNMLRRADDLFAQRRPAMTAGPPSSSRSPR